MRELNLSERTERIVCALTDGNSIFFVCTGTPLLVLCAISFTRYMAIKYPFGSKLRMRKRGAYIFNILAWISNIILMVPSLLSYKYSSAVGACVRDRKAINSSGTSYRMVLFMLTLCLPVIFLLLSYFALRRNIENLAQDLEIESYQNQLAKMRTLNVSKKAEKILKLLVLNFLICWLPFLFYWMLASVSIIFDGSNEARTIKLQIARIAARFTLLSCSLDPFCISLEAQS